MVQFLKAVGDRTCRYRPPEMVQTGLWSDAGEPGGNPGSRPLSQQNVGEPNLNNTVSFQSEPSEQRRLYMELSLYSSLITHNAAQDLTGR